MHALTKAQQPTEVLLHELAAANIGADMKSA